jgi:hypothetical protein
VLHQPPAFLQVRQGRFMAADSPLGWRSLARACTAVLARRVTGLEGTMALLHIPTIEAIHEVQSENAEAGI